MGVPITLGQLGQFHENPAVIAWWRTLGGRVLEWLTPARRRTILVLGAIYIGFKEPLDNVARKHNVMQLPDQYGAIVVALLVFALLWLCYKAAHNFKSLPEFVRRHPYVSLHLLYWGLILFLLNTTSALGEWRSLLVGIAFVFPYLIWRCGYLLQSGLHGRVAGTRFRDHLFYLWPAYGGSNTPYGKGFDYLSRSEAKSAEELARSQLAGIKLLLLSLTWSIVMEFWDCFVYGSGNSWSKTFGVQPLIPRLKDLAEQPGMAPVWVAWASLYGELVRDVLKHAVGGHVIIAALRIFGFNVFRNTYKPLLAESLVSFWGRYYYYFKELLVTFFFMPTFAQLGTKLRNWPNLRLLAAVFAAAFVGNVYYHVMSAQKILGGDWHVPWPRVFYCFLLAVGIFISMWREKRRAGVAPPAGLGRRVLRIAGVWTFFGIIMIWHTTDEFAFYSRTMFFLSLFGLS